MREFERIAKIIRFLDEHHSEQPDLKTLAAQAGLSPFHFHRLFSHWAGITPKDFLQCLTLSHAKRLLDAGESVLETALDAGLSGPGRLHDLCVSLEAASPGEIKASGAGWTIKAGFTDSPFGVCLVGRSARGICHLSFFDRADRAQGEAAIHKDWPLARVHWDDPTAGQLAAQLFTRPGNGVSLRAFVRGKAFQVRVWRALLRVPPGALVSYGRLAEVVGRPSAARAVGTAVSRNPLAYIIPCHRVIHATGVLGDYRWGVERKRAIVAWETAPSLKGGPLALALRGGVPERSSWPQA
ncbi:MAG: methylated-DNA--[protein]-cysteine S-methyltransferase [Bryobacterales bacterium]|nr:methylated-DNA--[protein]-cysteine S-methyltransferase [Bryobacterales bacterium]MDE0294164.1 methylated-DNA--[protein]-cysteine S-methyltransferase [Bryobacterales bacterium]MDE0435253.1 methylated-DNA--[protein]-cysteine S-methyltransferase [Bryobacterales bacterium]